MMVIGSHSCGSHTDGRNSAFYLCKCARHGQNITDYQSSNAKEFIERGLGYLGLLDTGKRLKKASERFLKPSKYRMYDIQNTEL